LLKHAGHQADGGAMHPEHGRQKILGESKVIALDSVMRYQ
jgi:hypothetical protein